MRRAIGRALRRLADRVDHDGALRVSGLRFGYVEHVGLVVGWHGTVNGPAAKVGAQLFIDPDTYYQAHHPEVGRYLRTPVPL